MIVAQTSIGFEIPLKENKYKYNTYLKLKFLGKN